MYSRRSLGLPITLAVVMIVLLVAIAVGWVLLAIFGASADPQYAGLYWAFLSVGSVLLVLVLIGTAVYLWLSIQVINLNRRQSNFIDSVTHELKSPIASLKLFLQTLYRRNLSEAQRTEFYRRMLADCERLDTLINHLLDAGRLERDQTEGDLEDLDLSEILADCAKQVCQRYEVPLATIGLDVDSCILRARRVELQMIFRNLLDNAVKYAGSTPVVKVTLWLESNGRIIAQISDNGRGVPDKMRDKIFERFERGGLELERETSGTGLGLYIVHTLVTRMQGTVTVRDGDDGIGSVFEVQIPGGEPGEALPPAIDSESAKSA